MQCQQHHAHSHAHAEYATHIRTQSACCAGHENRMPFPSAPYNVSALHTPPSQAYRTWRQAATCRTMSLRCCPTCICRSMSAFSRVRPSVKQLAYSARSLIHADSTTHTTMHMQGLQPCPLHAHILQCECLAHSDKPNVTHTALAAARASVAPVSVAACQPSPG
jgi:hypothetical protein